MGVIKQVYKLIKAFILILLCVALLLSYLKYRSDNKALKEIINRLEADSRIAEVLVTDVRSDEATGKILTTIKFLEYDVKGRPLPPQYFTFTGNLIQFQSLVVRFDDIYIQKADRMKGKSAYLFWKVFMLDGSNTQEYEITKANDIPQGYKVYVKNNTFEERLWKRFWAYALNPKEAKSVGIKNAQIEAPGTRFIPGLLYTIKIEHDGGIRIDTLPIPNILKGETIRH